MGSSSSKITHDFFPFVRVYEDGRVKRMLNYKPVPPTDNPTTGVRSKDVVIVPETNVWVRLYLPRTTGDDDCRKFPLLIFIHGGAFCLGSASDDNYDNFLHSLTAEANTVTLSVEYRLAPEHKLPACYDDSWSAIEWAWTQMHAKDDGGQSGAEPWLKNHADFSRVFFAGDSAGATIAHNMMVRASDEFNLKISPKPVGMILLHPFFGNHEKNKFWEFLCPDTTGPEDPLFNPAAHPGLLSKLVCSKVLVCIAEWDLIRESGNTYYEALKNSEWRGELELEYSKKRTHVFFLGKRNCDQARSLMKKIVSFINNQP
nr:2-hydroxyisoflavanone dehydratase-like [Ipomoea trifida]